MRIRATVAAVTGALALSAFVSPAAQAAGTAHSPAELAKAAHAAHQAASGKSAFSTSSAADTGEPYMLDLTFSNVKINKGKPIVAGTSKQVTVPLTFTVTHGADVDIHASDVELNVDIYRGTLDSEDGNVLFGDNLPTCTDTSATTASCTGTVDVYPDFELTNADATTWKAEGYAFDWNDQNPLDPDLDWSKVGFAYQDALTTTKLQRYSKLTVNASPEPVKKGKTVTVTGKLTRANWDDHEYHGYTKQSVKLQYRKKSSTTYTTLKTITSDSTGYLRTTTTATADGYYRYSFAGTSTTPAVNATGDYVDVQ